MRLSHAVCRRYAETRLRTAKFIDKDRATNSMPESRLLVDTTYRTPNTAALYVVTVAYVTHGVTFLRERGGCKLIWPRVVLQSLSTLTGSGDQ